jgi:hypothetical protein
MIRALFLALLLLLGCRDREAAADGAPPFPDGRPSDVLPVPDDADPAQEAEAPAEEGAPGTVTLSAEQLAQDAEPLPVEGVVVDPMLLDPEDVLLQQILHEAIQTLPAEWVIVAELVTEVIIITVQKTIQALAREGRLNPGEGQFTDRQEKLVIAVVAFLTFLTGGVVRYLRPAPARLAAEDRALMERAASRPVSMEAQNSEAIRKAFAAKLADMEILLDQRDRRIKLLEKSNRQEAAREADARLAARPTDRLRDDALVEAYEAAGRKAMG